MQTVSVPDLELMEVHFDSDPERKRARVNFPVNKWAGADASAVVCFELDPGSELATHTDSAEEVLYIVSGSAEAKIGEETGRVKTGDLVVIPSMAPHGLVNDGDETLEVVGFFASAEVESTFEEPVQPIGIAQMVQGAPPPSEG